MVTKHTVHDSSALKRFPLETAAISSDEKRKDKKSAVPMLTPGPAPDAALVLTGADLLKLNDHQWSQVCAYPEIVFSRTTPDQKLRIVRELQARDEVVGMTGDGVNDAPALKAADIGISLASGSDIAMEAADMVLLDSFAAIVEAIKYGRLVFDNLKKIIAYLLPAGSWSEFWPVFTNVVFGLPQILSSFLMIIIWYILLFLFISSPLSSHLPHSANTWFLLAVSPTAWLLSFSLTRSPKRTYCSALLAT